jgi:hypothetical protein
MSRQVRYRITALVAGGLLLGIPLLTDGTANAGQTGDGGREVVFDGGGVLGLSCSSHPDVESLTVPADTTVRVINHTGHSAQLRLGGTPQGRIPDDGSTELTFRRGTTAVLLSPACALGDESTPLLVTAMPSDPAMMPGPISAPSDAAAPFTAGGSASASTGGSASASTGGSASASTGGSALPDSAPAGPARSTSPSATAARASRSAGAASVVQAMPQGGSASPRLTRTLRGTRGAAAAFSGMPPGDTKRLLPGVPTIGLPQVTDVVSADVPPAAAVAAEPVAATASLPGTQPIGLLAVTAAVCVLGVGAAAIRAIVSQRASRTPIA